MTVLRESKEDPNKWSDIPCLWIGRLIFTNVKPFHIDVLIQGNLNKISSSFFMDIDNHLKMYKEKQ